MKLFSRYSLINLLASIAIFLVASLAFYFSLRFVLINQIDEDLKIEEAEINAYVHKHDRLPENFSVSDQVIRFARSVGQTERQFTTVNLAGSEENKREQFRRLTFGIQAGGQLYKTDVSKSLEGTDNLLQSILVISVSTILLILLVAAVINRVLLKKLWKPFYQSLAAVKKFRISRNQPLSLPETSIEEFTLLNQTLTSLTNNVRLEYLALKTFSENASHEFQTPIAIIRSKLDLLIQDEQLSQTQGEVLQTAYNAVEKLSRLNRSLLQLAKIENNQYHTVEMIDVKQKMEEKLQDFQELWQSHAITVQTELEYSTIKMNRELADVMLNNLLSNATNHNYSGGRMSISLNENHLQISNTSKEPALNGEKIFQRFYKPSPGSAHNGLGLSILKQIAEVSSFALRYAYINNEHVFSVNWQRS
jgi:signal transduction histidine kinase